MNESEKPFRVLSIDGGGMRGIYTAAYLNDLASAFAKKRGVGRLDIGAAFDLVVGTSAGAIAACALVSGIEANKVVGLFRLQGARVFPHKLPGTPLALLYEILTLRLLRRRRALRRGEVALRAALQGAFQAVTLRQVYQRRRIAMCVTAVEMSQHRSWVFKTPHLNSSFGRDDDCTLVDVCLASGAAPLFRSLARIQGTNQPLVSRYFADGGLWANNPVLVALVEAIQMLVGEPTRPLEIFSLGTCPRPDGTILDAESTDWGLLRWRFGGRAAQLSLSAQEYAFDNIAKLLAPHVGRRCRVIRFPNGPVPASLLDFLDLDETRPVALDALVAQAAADADVTMSVCNRDGHAEGETIRKLFEAMPEAKEE